MRRGEAVERTRPGEAQRGDPEGWTCNVKLELREARACGTGALARAEDSQHHRQPACSWMDARPLLGSWILRVACSALTSHARTTPSTLHEYTWLEAETRLILSLKHTLYVSIQKRTRFVGNATRGARVPGRIWPVLHHEARDAGAVLGELLVAGHAVDADDVDDGVLGADPHLALRHHRHAVLRGKEPRALSQHSRGGAGFWSFDPSTRRISREPTANIMGGGLSAADLTHHLRAQGHQTAPRGTPGGRANSRDHPEKAQKRARPVEH